MMKVFLLRIASMGIDILSYIISKIKSYKEKKRSRKYIEGGGHLVN